MSKRIDLTGEKFGRLTVMKADYTDKNYRLFWRCVCSCGNVHSVRGDQLKSGSSKSCGCLNSELVKIRALKKSAEGRVKDERLYNIWQGMRQRCYDENAMEYHRYGARGIAVCNKWLNSYSEFKKWSLRNGYHENLSIDRKDNDGNYEPENCKWSTPKQQANNRRNSIFITYEGETKTLAQWSEKTKIAYSCLYRRYKSDWPVKKMLTP